MSLTFVHLSDIHFQKKSGDTYDLDQDLRDQLERDISLMAKSVKPIHGVLVTGDIAFSGNKNEYAKAKTWLSGLCQKIGCDEKHIWMVPGNHDVDRGVIQNNKGLQSIHTELRSKTLNGPAKESKLSAILRNETHSDSIFQPMVEYCRIADKYGCGISPARPFWEETFKLGEKLKLKIRGLTSTLISDGHDNDRENKLLLGQAQATLKEEDDVVYMTLCHHPPDWLMDKDEIEHNLNLRARIQLFGHKHKQNFSYIDYNNTNKTLKLVAGAVHPDREEMDWKPRYNIISLDGSETPASLQIRLYPRVWNEDTKQFTQDPLCGAKDCIEYPPLIETDPVLHNVPEKPAQYLERPAVYKDIKDKLLGTARSGDTKAVGLLGKGAKVGVHGMGGVGKTILATALAWDEEAHRTFPGGIFWLTVGLPQGSDPKKDTKEDGAKAGAQEAHIMAGQRQLAISLGISSPDFKNIQEGKIVLEKLLRNKVCLIILDDVWDPQYAAAFNVLGPKSRLLITTRIGDVLSDINADKVTVDLLSEDEAKELLAKWAGQTVSELPTCTFYVAKECGYLPLALSMVGAIVKKRPEKIRAWQDVLQQLEKKDFEKIKSHFPEYRNRSPGF